jgi:Domain of unknown function (DUF4395)
MPTNTNTVAAPDQVDVRGPRFTAWVTTVVIVAALVAAALSSSAAAAILGVQTVVFAIGAWRGPRQHPYGLIFQRLVAPRLGPITEKEPAPPLKFAQLVGLVFAAVGVITFAAGVVLICLGCQLHPLVARFHRAPSPA